MGYIYAMQAAFHQQIKLIMGSANYLVILIGAVPTVAMLAWIAGRGDNPTVLAYISVGSGLMIIWNSAPTRMGWLLADELGNGTLELNLVSRTPVMFVLLGKVLAVSAFNTLGGLVAFFTVLIVSQELVDIGSVALLIPSLFFAMIAIVATGYIFSPLFLLVGGGGGSFNALVPFGAVCGGFLYPISILPTGLETVARFLPTSWAMDGVIRSIQGQGSAWTIAGDWGIAMALAVAWFGMTYFMFKKVEERVRVTGVLSTY